MVQNFGTSLSREQMKNVNGGKYDLPCNWFINTNPEGCNNFQPASVLSQEEADQICFASDCCSNVDCPGT